MRQYSTQVRMFQRTTSTGRVDCATTLPATLPAATVSGRCGVRADHDQVCRRFIGHGQNAIDSVGIFHQPHLQ